MIKKLLLSLIFASSCFAISDQERWRQDPEMRQRVYAKFDENKYVNHYREDRYYWRSQYGGCTRSSGYSFSPYVFQPTYQRSYPFYYWRP